MKKAIRIGAEKIRKSFSWAPFYLKESKMQMIILISKSEY